jgi:hypothetical protein
MVAFGEVCVDPFSVTDQFVPTGRPDDMNEMLYVGPERGVRAVVATPPDGTAVPPAEPRELPSTIMTSPRAAQHAPEICRDRIEPSVHEKTAVFWYINHGRGAARSAESPRELEVPAPTY